MIEVDIRLRRGDFALDARFAAPGGGITAVHGPSGAGKSTLFAAIAGLARPDSGRIALDGAVAYDGVRGIDIPPERRRVGCVFQDIRLFPHLSVRANLLYGARRGRAGELVRIVDLLDIAPLIDRSPRSLSGGERQRVAIGRALLSEPRLLLMDEPVSSLDPALKAELLPYIERLPAATGVAILYISHAIDEVLRLADWVVRIERGRVIVAAPVEEAFGTRAASDGEGLHPAETTVLRAHVLAHDEADGLTSLALDGAPGVGLSVPRLAAAPGDAVRALVQARDVALARARPEAISVQNILPARVVGLESAGASHASVALDIGVALRARITLRAARLLALEPGSRVFALIKSVAIDPL